jgi:hypothetical protein
MWADSMPERDCTRIGRLSDQWVTSVSQFRPGLLKFVPKSPTGEIVSCKDGVELEGILDRE